MIQEERVPTSASLMCVCCIYYGSVKSNSKHARSTAVRKPVRIRNRPFLECFLGGAGRGHLAEQKESNASSIADDSIASVRVGACKGLPPDMSSVVRITDLIHSKVAKTPYHKATFSRSSWILA